MENKEDKGGKAPVALIIIVVLGILGIVIYELAGFTVRTAHNIANGGWKWILVVLVPAIIIGLSDKAHRNK